MQVADDDASVAWELLASFREMLCAPSLVEREFVASRSWKASARAGLPGRGDREPRTINVAGHGHHLDRLAMGVLLMPFAEEQSAGRGSRQAAQ